GLHLSRMRRREPGRRDDRAAGTGGRPPASGLADPFPGRRQHGRGDGADRLRGSPRGRPGRSSPRGPRLPGTRRRPRLRAQRPQSRYGRGDGRDGAVVAPPRDRDPGPRRALRLSPRARRRHHPLCPLIEAGHGARRRRAVPVRVGTSTRSRTGSEARAGAEARLSDMYISRPDAKIFYQVTGSGSGDLFLCPPCQPVVGGRMWKNNLPYLARHFRVATMDPRGHGRSDRPPTGYDFATRYGDLVAVLEQTMKPPFALVAFTCSTMLAVHYVLDHPGAVSHLVLMGPQYKQSLPQPFEEKVARVIREDFAGWSRRLFTKLYPEPHSLRAVEDHLQWVQETAPDVLVEALGQISKDNVYGLLGKLDLPTLLIHGTDDSVVPYSHGQKFAAAVPGARRVPCEGGGRGLNGRDCVNVTRLIRDFVLDRRVESITIPRTTERKAPAVLRGRPARRVLWLSSPIGLGHIQRDIAI